jgi:hypothetical protein
MAAKQAQSKAEKTPKHRKKTTQPPKHIIKPTQPQKHVRKNRETTVEETIAEKTT